MIWVLYKCCKEQWWLLPFILLPVLNSYIQIYKYAKELTKIPSFCCFSTLVWRTGVQEQNRRNNSMYPTLVWMGRASFLILSQQILPSFSLFQDGVSIDRLVTNLWSSYSASQLLGWDCRCESLHLQLCTTKHENIFNLRFKNLKKR